jgi:hypothetical protein
MFCTHTTGAMRLLLKLCEDSEGFGDELWSVAHGGMDAKVDDVQAVHAEVAQVVVDGVDELLARECAVPAFVVIAAGADLGDDDEAVAVGVERFADDLVDDVRAVEVGGVDVVDAAFDGFMQNGDGFVAVAGRAPDARAGELHSAVAHAVNGEGRAGECEGVTEVGRAGCCGVHS